LEEVPENTDPFRDVVSLNIHRRHLTDTQRAMIAAKVANMSRGGQAGNTNAAKKEKSNPPMGGFDFEPAISIAEAADMLNVSEFAFSRSFPDRRLPGPRVRVFKPIVLR
jgi:hypothetical protein